MKSWRGHSGLRLANCSAPPRTESVRGFHENLVLLPFSLIHATSGRTFLVPYRKGVSVFKVPQCLV